MFELHAIMVGVMVTLFIALVGMKVSKAVEPHQQEDEFLPTQTDLNRKLMLLSAARYCLETIEHQRLLTHCFRIRLNKEIPRTFVDVCDDFFTGFHTYAFDKDGKAVGDTFNAYSYEPPDESGYSGELCPGETIVTPDQLNQLR